MGFTILGAIAVATCIKCAPPPYHRIAKFNGPAEPETSDYDTSSKAIEKTLEFRLACPLYEENSKVRPESGDYLVLGFLVDRESEKETPNFSPLLERARSFSGQYLKAKAIWRVAQAVAEKGDNRRAVSLVDESLAIAKSLANDSPERGDIHANASHLLAGVGDLDRAIQLNSNKGGSIHCHSLLSIAAEFAKCGQWERLMELFGRIEQEAELLPPEDMAHVFARLAVQQAAVGDVNGADQSIARTAHLVDRTSENARKHVAWHRQRVHRAGTVGKHAPVTVRDENWREKALQVANWSARGLKYQSLAEYQHAWEAASNQTVQPRKYIGTRVAIAADGEQELLERVALTLIHQDYLPDDRLEDFRFLFDTPWESRWLRGWFGVIHEITHEERSVWTVRVSFHPILEGDPGGVLNTYRAYLETWRYDASNAQMEFRGGKGLGWRSWMSD